jgi:hypothetical protein
MFMQGIVGPQSASSLGSGTPANLRAGQLNDLIVSELHGKWYESTYRGNVYSIGMSVTALSANTITTSATTTPIIGVWNPSTSTVNLVLAKAKLQLAVTAASAVAPGGFVWATSIGNTSLTLGLNPLNRKTLTNVGSQAKGFNITTALTGLTNALTIQQPAGFGTLCAAQGATVTPIISGDCIEEFDGGMIIPPGGLICLLNTISTTTVSVASMLMWEEVPV